MRRSLFLFDKGIIEHSSILDIYLEEIKKYPLLSAREEIELSRRIKGGDNLAFDKLVNSNLRFVVKVAHKYRGSGVSIMDLINEGNIGLIKAAKKFDETKGVRFTSYAVWWIRRYVEYAQEQYKYIMAEPYNRVVLFNKIRKFIEKFINENGRAPEEEEIALVFHKSPDYINEILAAFSKKIYLDSPLTSEDGSDNLLSVIYNEDLLPNKELENADRYIQTERVLNKVPLDKKEIFYLSFGFNSDFEPMEAESISFRLKIRPRTILRQKERAIKSIRLNKISKNFLNFDA